MPCGEEDTSADGECAPTYLHKIKVVLCGPLFARNSGEDNVKRIRRHPGVPLCCSS